MIRRWIKEVIRQVIKEEVKNCPLIISNRPPKPEDHYEEGTVWTNGEETFIAREVKVQWDKL